MSRHVLVASGMIRCLTPSRTRTTLPVENPDGSASCSGCGALVPTEGPGA